MNQLFKLLAFAIIILMPSIIKGQTAIAPATGDGSMGSPYEIATLENLYWIAESNTRWGFSYRQTADIDATTTSTWNSGSGWTPIGNSTVKFTGTYDGYDHKITELFINRPASQYQGLFGIIDNASISNLTLEEIQITASNVTGGIAGETSNSSSIQRCHVKGSIIGSQSVGGITGFTNNSIIEECSAEVSVKGRTNVGGIVGGNFTSSTIVYCYSKGTITATSTEETYGFGGLVGYNMATIEGCFSKCNVISGMASGGGLIGYNSGYLNSCYSTGNTSLLGSGSSIGGLIGYNSGTVTSSYWDIESSGNLTSAAGIGKTTIEMKTQSTFIGWDFDIFPVWQISSRYYYGYPYLGWMSAPLTPMISTTSVDNITGTRASVKGEFVSLGYTDPTQHGFCWSTSQNPTIADSKVELGSAAELKSFTSPIEGLSLSTTYYLRAFATNSHGTVYGEEIEFTTLPFNGSGTELDPFQIGTLSQLEAITKNSLIWDKLFIQIANIDAAETSGWNEGKGWNPIIYFTGSYDGQGFTISNLYSNRLTENNVGLFQIVYGGNVQNLNLENLTIKGQINVGGLTGSINQGATITNVHVSGSVESSSNYCGGLIGNIGTGSVSHCSNSASIVGKEYTGGVLGNVQYNGIVENSFNTGSVTSTGSRVGGFVGESFGDIIECYSTGDVQGVNYVGGFIGYGQSKPVVNCYSTGNVQGTSHVGGFAGTNFGKIYSCYSTGNASGSSSVAGFLSLNSGIVTNCFWDKTASGNTWSGVGIGKTTAEMKTLSTFTSATWDFKGYGTEGIWNIGNSRNNGYPYLDWEYPTDKASQTITFLTIYPKTYGDNAFEITASSSSGLPIAFSTVNNEEISIADNFVTIYKAGDVSIVASQEGNEMFSPAAPVERFFTIEKDSLAVTAISNQRVYDGQPTSSVDFEVSITSFAYDDNVEDLTGTITFSGDAVDATSAGVYEIIPSGYSSDNYEIWYFSGDYEITKAPLTVLADNKTKIYGDSNPTLTFSFDGFVNGEDETSINIPSIYTFADEFSDAGNYEINLVGGSADNYYLILLKGNLEITKAPLTATAESKTRTYGAANPEFTVAYSGFVNGEDASVITVPLASTLADATSPVGLYDITLAGGESTNYELTLANGQLEITKAPLTATAESKTRTYGAANPEFTVAYSGFVNGEDASVITVPLASTLADATSPVGLYNITLAGGESTNYELTLANGQLEITKAPLTATADSKTRAYGAANPALTVAYDGFVNGEDASAINEPVASTLADETSSVGQYDISLTGGDAINYELNLVNGLLEVTKANLIVTADDKTRYEGEENPMLTVSYAGFVNGEDELVLDELPEATTVATIESPAGEYSINPSGGSDNNYWFTYESGTLSVLAIPTYQVTFNVTSSSSGALEGVSITIDQETLTTNEVGEAYIMLANGTYSYTVTSEGFDTITDEVVVADEEKVVTITLTPVGVDSQSLSSIKLYPNPFSNRLVIEKTSNIDLVQIVNISGQVITVIKNNGMDEIIIDGNNLTEGIYLIRLFDKNGNQIVKKAIRGSL